MQLTNSAAIYTNSWGHVKGLTRVWDDIQKELENSYAPTHQFAPRPFKSSAAPWNDDKDSHILSSEQTALRKLILQPLPEFSVLNHKIHISFNNLENLVRQEGVCAVCAPFGHRHEAREV